MPESHIDHCLDLCARASGLRGEELAHLFRELHRQLESMLAGETANLPDLEAPCSPWTQQPVITMDMAGYLTGWNPGAQKVFGYTAEEAIGRHILFLYADEPNEGNNRIRELFLDQGMPLIEVRRRKKSGEVFRANLALSHVFDENHHPVAIVAHLSEVTDKLSTEDRHRLHA